jgi:hypothetical protein
MCKQMIIYSLPYSVLLCSRGTDRNWREFAIHAIYYSDISNPDSSVRQKLICAHDNE